LVSIHEIENELLIMKEELETCLAEKNNERNPPLYLAIKEELKDVKLALNKLHTGKFGICEETSQVIPLEKLQMIPTARTINDFSITNYFEKNTVF